MTKGHHTFDHALQEANIWLKAVEKQLHCSEHEAYQALRVTLHALRDRLPQENAVKLAAQLPMLIRGVFYEGWQMGGTTSDLHNAEEFSRRVKDDLPVGFPLDGKAVAKGVFEVLWERLDPGESAKITDLLSPSLRHLWPEISLRKHG